jgi:hypothetical protein
VSRIGNIEFLHSYGYHYRETVRNNGERHKIPDIAGTRLKYQVMPPLTARTAPILSSPVFPQDFEAVYIEEHS